MKPRRSRRRKRRGESAKAFIYIPINKLNKQLFDGISSEVLQKIDPNATKINTKNEYHITLLKGEISNDRRNIANFLDEMQNISKIISPFYVKVSNKMQTFNDRKIKQHAIIYIDDNQNIINTLTRSIQTTLKKWSLDRLKKIRNPHISYLWWEYNTELINDSNKGYIANAINSVITSNKSDTIFVDKIIIEIKNSYHTIHLKDQHQDEMKTEEKDEDQVVCGNKDCHRKAREHKFCPICKSKYYCSNKCLKIDSFIHRIHCNVCLE